VRRLYAVIVEAGTPSGEERRRTVTATARARAEALLLLVVAPVVLF
jgi:hypothetical protein